MDAIPSGLRADIDHRIALAGSTRVENLIFSNQAQRKRVHQRIARVARLELCLATKVGHAEAVAIGSNACDNAFENGVVAVDFLPVYAKHIRASLGRTAGDGCSPTSSNGPKAQRIHNCDGPCAHGENVAENSAYAGGCALKRFDERGVIVRLYFESASPAVSDVDDARVFSRSLHHQLAACGQA